MYETYVLLCQEQGISPSRLAKELGIGPSTITDWKNGRKPRPDKIKVIADHFGVSVAYLMGTKTEKDTPVSEDALDEQLMVMLKNLSPDKIQRVKDFVSGISSI